MREIHWFRIMSADERAKTKIYSSLKNESLARHVASKTERKSESIRANPENTSAPHGDDNGLRTRRKDIRFVTGRVGQHVASATAPSPIGLIYYEGRVQSTDLKSSARTKEQKQKWQLSKSNIMCKSVKRQNDKRILNEKR